MPVEFSTSPYGVGRTSFQDRAFNLNALFYVDIKSFLTIILPRL